MRAGSSRRVPPWWWGHAERTSAEVWSASCARAEVKHGVIGLTRSVALECAAERVRVNALINGNVDTPLYRGMLGAGPDDDLCEAPNPTKRAANPAEIAAFVAFLLSDEAAFITGAALPIDGGATAR